MDNKKLLFNRYLINKTGLLIDIKTGKEIKYHNHKAMIFDGENRKNYTLKSLYFMAFKENYCIDTIENLPAEEWR